MNAEEIRHLFIYDDGVLLWRRRPALNSRRRAGEVAGSPHIETGRWRIRLQGHEYLRSRLVWLYHHGHWPPAEIDHVNRDPADDRIENLRAATRSQNLSNRGKMGHNTSGYRAIYFDKRKRRWAVRISVNGKRKRHGTFATAEEAAAVADRIGRESYGEFWIGG